METNATVWSNDTYNKMKRIVRKALLPDDGERIMEVFASAKTTMRASGNMNQWTDGYPSLDAVRTDVERGGGYVIEDDGGVVGYFAFLPSPEPTYSAIYNGAWTDDVQPYHVVHRIAGMSGVHGIFKSVMDFCFAHDSNIRVDTHRDNRIMQHNLEKEGFGYCGIIYLANGDERLAYQKLTTDLACTVERFEADIDTRSYIDNYRRADYFMQFCRECRNYGRRYGCPPFDFDPLTVIGRYDSVRIIGVKITPRNKQLPLSRANDLMEPVIAGLNKELLEIEKSLGGYCCGFVGSCPYCGGMTCARIEGKPCRHPDKVRPSLEAFGFDMGKTAQQLLGLDIKWSKGDTIPEYLTLVCGIFYGRP